MNQSLDHLPEQKQNELKRVATVICKECDDVEMIVLFGSYARGDWKDGPHEQGRGRLTIHKKSDYDILVITAREDIARNISLWDRIKEECAKQELSTYVRIIPRDIEFINFQLMQGQYFFTDIANEGISLYDSGNSILADRQELDPAEEKQIAQDCLDEVFHGAKVFYDTYQYLLKGKEYKHAAFNLNQACEHSYKSVLLIFGGECPQEHHLDVLGDRAAGYCPELTGILPRETAEQRKSTWAAK